MYEGAGILAGRPFSSQVYVSLRESAQVAGARTRSNIPSSGHRGTSDLVAESDARVGVHFLNDLDHTCK